MKFFTFIIYFTEKFLSTNSVNPDQMHHSAVSDLGLHCLHMFSKWAAGLKKKGLGRFLCAVAKI